MDHTEEEEEEKLLEEITRDPQKFGELFDAYYKPIFGYIYRRTMDYDSARDIAAETFLKAFSGIGRFTWRAVSVRSWLYRIATNELNRYFNHRTYTAASLARIREEYGIRLTEYSNAETERVEWEEELARHQQFIRINERLKRMKSKYQEVIALRYYEQKSISEIAMILGKNEGTIKSLLSRGLAALREEFGG